MHIANVIVRTRAMLGNAEAHYGSEHRGMAAEVLTSLGVYLHKELPGMTTEPDPVEPEAEDLPNPETSDAVEGSADSEPEATEQPSQKPEDQPGEKPAEIPDKDKQTQ